MALVLKDRVKETTTTTGTGTITLAGAVVGYQTFSVIGNSNTTYYVIEDADGAGWEVGIGTYTLSGTTLARTTVLASTNSNTQISLSSGTHTVFCSYPAGKSVNTADNLSVMAATTSAQLAGVISDETGSGSVVFATSPTLVTPALGTPSALVATNATGTAASLTAGTATLATDATSITVSANNTADETVYPLFVDGATGSQGAETDTGLTYNPSSGLLTSTLFAGALTGNVTGDASGSSGSCTGNAATVTTNANLTGHITSTGNAAILGSFTVAQLSTALSDASISGNNTGDQTTVSGSSGSCTGNAATATEATSITVSANNTADETVYPLFVDGATGSQGAETDTGLTYNPSSGLLTSTLFAGALTGNVTGNASGTAATVTGGTQAAITSAANLVTIGTVTSGTLSTGAVLAGVTVTMGSDAEGDIYYRNASGVLTRLAASTDGHVLTATGAGSAPAWEAATGGTPTVITVADESTDTTCFPLFVTAATGDLGPKSGSNLTFNSNTGVLTATGFAGPLTGNVTGNASGTAATVTGGTQAAITSAANLATVGTITTGVWEGTAIAIAQGGTGATSLDDLLDLDQLSDVSYGGTNLTKTLLINKGLGVAPAHGTLGSDCTDNFAVGDSCLSNMTDASHNVAIGDKALLSNLTADHNIAFGYRALYTNTASNYNISMGYQSSFFCTGGSNLAMGQDSLKGVYGESNTSSHNIALGYRSLYGTTSGSSNVSIGQQSGAANSSGGKNIKLGYYAGTAATTESSTLYIANASESSNGTLIKGDMANKFLAIGKADVTLSTESSTLQVYPDGATDAAYYAKMATSHSADLIRIENNAGTELFKVDSAGVATASGFVGPLTGNVTGNASGTAATVTTAAQSAITSVGTLTALTVDNIIIDGTTIGHTSDGDLMTLVSGGLTLAGTLTVGVNDTGHDVKLFGATSGAYALFDESEDRLHLVGVNYVQEAVPANDTPTVEDATVTLDLKKGNYHNISLDVNVTKFEFTNAKRGQRFILRITQRASSAKTVSWADVDADTAGTAAIVRWAGNITPTMSTATSHTDVYGFLCTNDAGTAFDGFIVGQDLPD